MKTYKYKVYLDGDNEKIVWVSAESVDDAENQIEDYIENEPLVIGAEIVGAKLNG